MNTKQFLSITGLMLIIASFTACTEKEKETAGNEKTVETTEQPEYFSLRPELEKAYGYTHKVKIGKDIKISGAVSMDDKGNLTAPGDMEQQMKNCYRNLDKILKHYSCTFDDVMVENVLTTE